MHNLVVKQMAHDRFSSHIFQCVSDVCPCCNNHIINKNISLEPNLKSFSDWICYCNDFDFNILSHGYDHTIQILIFDFKFIFRITQSSYGGLNYSYIKLGDTALEIKYFDKYQQSFDYFTQFLSLYTRYKKLAVLV